LQEGQRLRDLSLEQWRAFHPVIEADLLEALVPRQVVAARLSEGGTAFVRVEEQLALWLERLPVTAC
jgi:argininosuccinate lyase